MSDKKDKDKQTRRFRCDGCGAVEFDITVEPNYPLDKDKAQWLRDCRFCPQCGEEIEET
jgi:ribosomal protein S27AE